MSESEQVKNIAEAARSFLRVYDEFDGDPSCVGEYLDALLEKVAVYNNQPNTVIIRVEHQPGNIVKRIVDDYLAK